MTVAKFDQPNFLTQSASVYKANIDAAIAVLQSIGADFAPHSMDAPNMQVVIDAGRIFKPGGAMVSVAQQITGSLIAPVTNPRIDRLVVDSENGVYSVLTGTESASPTAPSIPNGKLPVAQIAMTVGQTTIANSIITDERTTYGPLAKLMRMPVEAVNSTTGGFVREILLADRGILFDCDCSNGPITIMLPDTAGAGNGFMIGVVKTDATVNEIIFVPSTTGEVFSDGSATKSVAAQNGTMIVTTDGLGQWYAAFDSSRTYNNVTLTGQTIVSGTLPARFEAGIGPDYKQNIGLLPSVNLKALTAAFKTKAGTNPSATSPFELAFRNATLTTGDYVIGSLAAAASVVAPNGATLGGAAASTIYLYVYALLTGTTIEPILSGSNHWDEGAVHTTTAIDAASDSGSVLYSTTARTNVPIKFVSRIRIQTGAVAGEWDNAPTEVHVGSKTEEEGAWTPSVNFGGASVGLTYTIQTGYFKKIGRMVIFSAEISINAKGTSVGNATITGLPFTSGSQRNGCCIGNTNTITFANQMFASISNATTSIQLTETTETGIRSNLDDTNFANASYIILSGTYFV